MVFENSTFDNNREGFDTNIHLVGDPPSQDGHCKGHKVSPITGTVSCWVFENNTVAYNNNANAPVSGSAGLGPVWTGLTVSGGRKDTVMNNRFVGNVAWGAFFVPFRRARPPTAPAVSPARTRAVSTGRRSASLP
jgi:hypothetical protein